MMKKARVLHTIAVLPALGIAEAHGWMYLSVFLELQSIMAALKVLMRAASASEAAESALSYLWTQLLGLERVTCTSWASQTP